jgi:hypothetical protein
LTVKPAFPHFTNRSPIVEKKELILAPIEVAITDIQSRISKLKNELNPLSGNPDLRTLSQFLSGSVCVQVNAGIGEVCNSFLTKEVLEPIDPSLIAELKLSVTEFFSLVKSALPVSRKLSITPEQLKLQEEFEKGYDSLWAYCSQFVV